MVAFLDSGEIKNALNVPAMSGELADKMGPVLDLAGKLGRFLAQVEQGVPQSLEIECMGDAADHSIDAITSAAVGGFLQHFLDVPVNAISAPHLAEDRGIEVRESKCSSKRGLHASQVLVRVRDDKGKDHVAAGTLGSDRSPRLVRWNDFDIEARLEGSALVIASTDKPGVIGFMGSTLGDAEINVASVFLGKSSQGQALSMWNLDDPMPAEVLAHVKSSPNVQRAVLIHL